ncbi:ATP-grasp domain-containing protein (plasmid) [Alkalihalophilus sp. As8PL]|uniref:ATP-grasp domain-containing protein n=1 Tax=Alkalihalophilus sp. As8PL TaxID=3237103 RepID=A0AB39BMQ4_9BACI
MEYVYFIESNSAGNGVKAMEYAKKKGLKTFFLTSMPEKYEKMEVNPLVIADEYKIIDTNDTVTLLHFFQNRNPIGILAFDDFHIIQASLIGKIKEVVTPSLEGLINCRFKDKTRKALEGSPGYIKYKLLESDSLLNDPLFYPCVVKPVDESGSVGVQICNNEDELAEALSFIDTLEKNISGYKYVKKALVEEYLDGDEYSAELVWDTINQNWHLIGFTKKYLSELPYRIEIGHLFPYYFNSSISLDVEKTIKGWLDTVGLNNCIAHVEFKLVDNKARLIEINPRPAGDQVNDLVGYALGKDLASYYLDMILNNPIEEKQKLKNDLVYFIKFILPPRSGGIENIEVNDSTDGVDIISYKVKTVKEVKGVKNSDDRLGYVITSGRNEKEAIESADHFIDNISINYHLEEVLNK